MRKIIQSVLFNSLYCIQISCSEVQKPLFNCSEYLAEPYGVTTHIALNNEKYGDYSKRDDLLLIARELGMTYARFDYEPGHAKEWADATNSVLKFGMKPFVVLSKWNYRKISRPWEDYNAYHQYLKSSIDMHGKDVAVWEIMNEVDLVMDSIGSKSNKKVSKGYSSILPSIVKYVRMKSPDSQITMGSICNWESSFVYTLFEEKRFEITDVFNFHAYNEPEHLIKGFENMKSKMDKFDCHPHFWLTECGMPTNLDPTKNTTREQLEEEQARRVARIHLISFACGVDKVFWYNLRSLENDPFNKESHFGLLHRDLSPKPSYYAYKALTTMCPSGSLRPILTIKDNIYMCYWVRSDGRHIWAIWSPKSNEQFPILVKGSCQYLNYMGLKRKKPEYINSGVTYLVGNKNTVVEFL